MNKVINFTLAAFSVFMLDFISTVIVVGILGEKCGIVEANPFPAHLQALGWWGWVLWLFLMLFILYCLFFIFSFISRKFKFKYSEDYSLCLTLITFIALEGFILVNNFKLIFQC
jgi:phosphotransferase system  glucose/maltose/N-acetylglucosamine-specific IIC component